MTETLSTPVADPLDHRCPHTLMRPVFLLGCHKSGTSLLRSLLDGHPDLAVLPTEPHFFELAGYWIDYGLRSRRPRLSLSGPADLKQVCLAQVRGQNDDRDPYSDSRGFTGYDLSVFERQFQPAGLRSPAEAMAHFLHALWRACTPPEQWHDRRIVEKSVEQAEFAALLKTWYPDAKFVHILRNPYATLSAIRRSRQKLWYPPLAPIIKALANSYYYLVRNQMHLYDDYLVIRYEDLVAQPEPVMSRVARFLGLAPDPGLARPTMLGRPWEGNSTRNQRFSAVDKAAGERWRDDIRDLEIELVNRICPRIQRAFGYEVLQPKRSLIRPIRKEGLRTYLRNRAAVEATAAF